MKQQMLRFSVVAVLALAIASTQARATCLTIDWSGTGFPAWVNHCSRAVYVNWTDQGSCGNWSCGDNIGPNRRSGADISRRGQVNWCEFYDGRTGRGPC